MSKNKFIWGILLVVALYSLATGGNFPIPLIGSPSPITTAGFRVVVFEEDAAEGREKLSSEQLSILNARGSGSVREYVESRGGQYLVLAKNDSLDRLEQPWPEIGKRPRESIPWFQAYDPPRWHEGPLPANTNEVLKLLSKVKP